MSDCKSYNPENVFKRFRVVEFPISCVGLWTSRFLDVEINLNRSAFLKTMCDGSLRKFEDAREISPSHRAFLIKQVDDHTLQITFHPTNECICNARHKKDLENRFIFDLRLIQVDGLRCCNNEFHSEIGRFYICGQYEYCKLSHFPKTINFGDVIINSKTTKYVRIRNESSIILAKFDYIRVTGFEVSPPSFTVPPNSSIRISITIKPTSLKIGNTLVFHVRNPHDIFDTSESGNDENYLPYTIKCKCDSIIYDKKPIPKTIESLHKINEQSSAYTYVEEDEKEIIRHRKDIAEEQMQISKLSRAKKPMIERFSSGKDRCYDNISVKTPRPPNLFCKKVRPRINTYSLFDISFLPYTLNFGRIALNSYGTEEVTIKNSTIYDVTIEFYQKDCVLYTDEKLTHFAIKLKSMNETKLTIFCLGFIEGSYSGQFEYSIDKKYQRVHPYVLQVGNPTLMLSEKNLKFGMTTSESFVTSVPVKIHNCFNVPVSFRWEGIDTEVPFKIIPETGNISQHSHKICDVIYLSKPTKTKTHEIEFISQGHTEKSVPVELNIMTRKLSIKFLQLNVVFKDVALNVETVQYVRLENSSREMAVYHIVEPLLPGIVIKPMQGNVRPKMVITFEIIVKISCVLEFAFDICLKVNNKENLILPVSGNVVEPKVQLHPKNIYMPRIPCNLVTYVPITFQNLSPLRTEIDIIDTGDENIFNVYVAHGNEKIRILHFSLEGGQSKQLFIKVTDIFRREYEMYIPIKINGLIGPPDFSNSWSTDLHQYIMQFEQQYENNAKVKLKSVNKDICYCRIAGVITVPWIELSEDHFEINYLVNGTNTIDFTITNISKYYLYVTIHTSKLSPYFTLNLTTEENQSIINETNIKFELDREKVASFTIKFHPKGHGRFVSTATLFLDKHMSIPYSNLTFIGKRQTPLMIPDTYRIIFPPCYIGTEQCRTMTVKLKSMSDLDAFSCMSKEEPNLMIKFVQSELIEEEDDISTLVTVDIKVCCMTCYGRNIPVSFHHETGSFCEIDISFCYTNCPLTLHTNFLVQLENNPYPYFPSPKCHKELYDYMLTCTEFLEKWMFQQGFRRDLYPVIPDTFHGISTSLSTQAVGAKSKGINVSYLNFVRRIAGPLMKYIRKTSVQGSDERFRQVHEIYDTYKEIIKLINARGVTLWVLQPRFLLSYDQFVIFCEYVTPKCNADILLTQELLNDINLFNRLSKQSWIDFILQSYKVFVMDSCFFDCVCVNSKNRDIVQVLVSWYNDHMVLHHKKLQGPNRPLKVITNLTTDLSDGLAIISTILSYCPFLVNHFALYCQVEDDSTRVGSIINNACLIIEAMNNLRLFFPLSSEEFLQPNFLQFLFLSIHLYVTLPMFNVKDTIKFNPPLLRTSTRLLSVSPTSQDSVTFNHIILNNVRNSFSVEKAPTSGENGKKMYLSVKYIANFISKDECILLVHGYNKTRIFDTYVVFILQGQVGALNPLRKCKVTGPLYRPVKVDVLVASPFTTTALYNIYLTDIEPVMPVDFNRDNNPKFYLRRLNLIENEIILTAAPKEAQMDVVEHKLYLQMMCLSTIIGTTWVWFRSDVGDFFIKITSQPRWDLAIDTLQAKVQSWPMDPCSCGESCECYRTSILIVPHRNELMLKALRYSLLEHTSNSMMEVFDDLIETTTGKIILRILLTEGGTNMADVNHILREELEYRVSSKNLLPRLERVRFAHHTPALLTLPITIPAHDKSEKYSIVFISECGSDIRTYKILFIETCQAEEEEYGEK